MAGGNGPVDPIVIIGGGPTGLGAAWQLEKLAAANTFVPYLLIEQETRAGGSATSMMTPEGFTFDQGSHVLYPHVSYCAFTEMINSAVSEWHDSAPIRGVLRGRTLIPYPVQQNLHRLPAGERVSAIAGLVQARIARRFRMRAVVDETMQDYLRRCFGRGLTNGILGTINRKMWAHGLDELGSYWASQRSGSKVSNVVGISIRDALRAAIRGGDTLGWAGKALLHYPLRGGTGGIWEAVAHRLPAANLRFGQTVRRIDSHARSIEFADGKKIRYGHLISTIPLDLLCALVSPSPGGELESLRFANAGLVGLGFLGQPVDQLRGVHSFHTPDEDFPCWRISLPASLSPGNAPAGSWSLLCEISHRKGASYDLDHARRRILEAFRRRGMINGSTLVSVWQHHIAHGYPVPSPGRDAILKPIQHALASAGIFSRGRFGGWKYEVSNMDHSFMQGVEVVNYIVGGVGERTYWEPESVN